MGLLNCVVRPVTELISMTEFQQKRKRELDVINFIPDGVLD